MVLDDISNISYSVYTCLQDIVEFVHLDTLGILVVPATRRAAEDALLDIIAQNNRHQQSNFSVGGLSKCFALLQCAT